MAVQVRGAAGGGPRQGSAAEILGNRARFDMIRGMTQTASGPPGSSPAGHASAAGFAAAREAGLARLRALASGILPELAPGADRHAHDSSTTALIDRFLTLREDV